jgi:hypothetical protein
MEFFKHSTTAQYSTDLKKIEHAYGVAGIGFYWRTIETLFLSQKPMPIVNLLKDGYKRLSRGEAEKIIKETGLFNIDGLYQVTLQKNVDYGIDKKSLDTYFTKLAFVTPPSCADAGAEADVQVCVQTSVQTCTDAVPFEIDKEKSREDKARETLDNFLQSRCPHLMEMDEPLTLEQFRELRKTYTSKQIERVLLDMENDKSVYLNRRSCYLTASSWLGRRCK